MIRPAGHTGERGQAEVGAQDTGKETIKSQLGSGSPTSLKRRRGGRSTGCTPTLTVLVDLDSGSCHRDREVDLRLRQVHEASRGLAEEGAVRGVQRKGMREMSRQDMQERPERRRPGRQAGQDSHSPKAKFTWLGSEDPESMVFPPGRPFIVEVKDPRRREVPSRLAARTGMGMIEGLRR